MKKLIQKTGLGCALALLIGVAPALAAPAELVVTGTTPIVIGGTSTTFKNVTFPCVQSLNGLVTFNGVLNVLSGSASPVISANATGVFVYDQLGTYATSGAYVVARVTNAAPDLTGTASIGTFGKFSAPVVNESNGDVAFLGTMKLSGTPSVTGTTDTGVWLYSNTGSLVYSGKLIAREGAAAPDTTGTAAIPGATFKQFTSMALPDTVNFGPVFLAKLSGSSVTTANNTGIWVTGSNGAQLALRTGDVLTSGTVKTISFLPAVKPAGFQNRNIDQTNTLTFQVTYTNKKQAIISISLP